MATPKELAEQANKNRRNPFTAKQMTEWRNKKMGISNTPKFEVVVGNIGTVYSGNNFMVASCKYSAYVKESKSGVGRAGNESVVMFHNGEIRYEHEGEINGN